MQDLIPRILRLELFLASNVCGHNACEYHEAEHPPDTCTVRARSRARAPAGGAQTDRASAHARRGILIYYNLVARLAGCGEHHDLHRRACTGWLRANCGCWHGTTYHVLPSRCANITHAAVSRGL